MTSFITIVQGGKNSKLYYRGYLINQLVTRGIPFETISWLLLYGDVPNQATKKEYDKFINQWIEAREKPEWLDHMIENFKISPDINYEPKSVQSALITRLIFYIYC